MSVFPKFHFICNPLTRNARASRIALRADWGPEKGSYGMVVFPSVHKIPIPRVANEDDMGGVAGGEESPTLRLLLSICG